MQANFDPSLTLVLRWEGGFSDDRHDPGGPTNRGITIATLRRNRPDATVDDLRRITMAECAAIYRSDYWDTVGGDNLASGLDLATFDASVNSGPGQARKWLARATRESGAAAQVRALCAARLGMLQGLRTWSRFGRGWARRVAGVEATALQWIGGTAPAEARQQAQKAKAKAGTAASTTGAGGLAGAAAVGPDWQAIAVLGVAVALIVGISLWKRMQESERVAALGG